MVRPCAGVRTCFSSSAHHVVRPFSNGLFSYFSYSDTVITGVIVRSDENAIRGAMNDTGSDRPKHLREREREYSNSVVARGGENCQRLKNIW